MITPSAAGLEFVWGSHGAGDRSQAADSSERPPDPRAPGGRAAETCPAPRGAGLLFPPGAAAADGLRPQGYWAVFSGASPGPRAVPALSFPELCGSFPELCGQIVVPELQARWRFGPCVLLVGWRGGVGLGGGCLCPGNLIPW